MAASRHDVPGVCSEVSYLEPSGWLSKSCRVLKLFAGAADLRVMWWRRAGMMCSFEVSYLEASIGV